MSDSAKSRFRSSILYGGLALCLSFAIGFVATALAGAGHGTTVFGCIVWAPAPFGAVIWPAVGASLPWARNYWIAIGITGLLLLHYLCVIQVLFEADTSYVFRTVQSVPGVVAFVVLSYVVAQVVIIFKLVSSFVSRRSGKTNCSRQS